MPFMTNILERKVLSCFDLVEHLVVSQIFFQCSLIAPTSMSNKHVTP